MTYLFKLARRLAFARSAVVLAVTLVACSEAAPREFLSPDPGSPPPSSGPVSLVVTASTSALPFDQTIPFRAWGRLASGDSVGVAVSWSATAGQIAADGMYRGTVPGTHLVTAYAVGKPSLSGAASVTVSAPGPLFRTLTVHPKPVLLFGGARVQFGATALLQSGANTLPTVTWRATGGSITANGEFLAGQSPGEFAVIATTLDGLLSDTAIVVVEPAALQMLQLDPRVVTLAGGDSQDFVVSTAWTDGSTEIPELEWETTAGNVTPLSGTAGVSGSPGDGLTARFTASTEPGNYKLVVRHRSSGKTDTAHVTITPVLQQVVLTPASLDMIPGVAAVFQARGLMSDGQVTTVSVSWSATGGTISGSGVYTAGNSVGLYRVVARVSGGTRADTAVVRITQPAATLSRIVVSPPAGTAPVGGTVDFFAAAEWSDGASTLPGITWSAQAGAVTQEGRWTAPNTPGSYRVVARHTGGTLSDTAVYSVVIPPPSLATLVVSPNAPGVQGGQVVNFNAQATWTDGSTTLPALTWSATAGTVTSSGSWTAPNISGVYRVVARATASGLADTAVVTVAEVPRVTLIRLTPRLGALNPGGTLQLTPAVSWSDGLSRSVTLTWTATKGTVSMSGLFTAGNLAGQALVIAGCAGCTVADTAKLTITEPVVAAPVVTQMVLNPATLTMGPGEAREVQVAAAWSDGSTTMPPLAWTAGGGTIQGYHYIAGSAPGSYALIVRDAGGTKADTTAVTVTGTPGGVTLSNLSLNPSSVAMVPGEQRTLTVGAAWSDGTTTLPPLSWNATGGTMSGLVFTAGATVGSYRVIASHQGGSLADTTVVTIATAPAGVTVTKINITPLNAFVDINTTRQYAATAQMSDGSTTTPAIQWTATGGTITGSGLYTAGVTAGPFKVIASCPSCGRTDTTAVTLTVPPPPPGVGANDRVIFPTPEVEFIVGPQLKAGSSLNPWPWHDANLLTKGMQHGLDFPVTPGADPNGPDYYINRNYYDLGLALYTAYYRSGNALLLTQARKVADSWWLHSAIGNGTTPIPNSFAPRNISLGGLMLRALDGRPEFWPWITDYVRQQFDGWVGLRLGNAKLYYGVRDGGYMLLYAAWLAKSHPSASVRAEFQQKVLNAATQYYARLQYPDGSWRWVDVDAGVSGDIMQPFMVGLLLDGMVATHRLTGDPTILAAITRSVENIYAVGYRGTEPVSQKPGVMWRGMWYFVYGNTCQAGCGRKTLDGGWDTNGIREVRELSPLVLHAFGYAYATTQDPKFRQWGDEIFAATFGKGQGPLADAYYSLADFREKEFNQNYRSAGRYLAWRMGIP